MIESKDIFNYFHCEMEGCNFKSKKRRNLVIIKGKSYCFRCKNKIGHKIEILNPNLSDNTLKSLVKLPEGRHMKRGKYKLRLGKKSKSIQTSLSLTKSEINYLKSHFKREKLSNEEIDLKIQLLKTNINNSHELYKQNQIDNPKSFKEAFEELINE